MSPYGQQLAEFIKRKELQQNKFAAAIGVLPNHVSQVIHGIKGPFGPETQEKINSVLNLTQQERDELVRLSKISGRSFRLGEDARPIEYQIAALLSDQATSNSERFIEVARLALAAHMARR
jgi:transcriptional regulator with XRE-family HTH domain